MIVIVCVSNNNGVMFNGRRQSQDKVLRGLLSEEAGDVPFWMSPYSEKQFTREMPANPVVDEDFLTKAAKRDLCFVEGKPLRPYLSSIHEIRIVHWNRDYPADVYLDVCPLEDGFVLSHMRTIAGSSHPEILMETFVRKETVDEE